MSVAVTGDGPNIALTGTGSSFTITVTTGSGGGGGGVTDHGLLTGLSDNDHPQYALSASLGDAALLDVGTTAGTVAAGDDSRLTNSRTPTGGAGGALSGTYPDPGLNTEAVQDLVGGMAGTGMSYDDTAGTLNVTVSGSVATDAIWDAAGDLAYGTGANTAAKLALGARGAALVAGATAPEWAIITPRLNVPMAVNDWVLLSTGYGSQGQSSVIGGSAAASNGAARYLPFFVGKRIGVNGLGIEVSTGNAGASAVIRMGIHTNSSGRPGVVVVDAGTASATAAAKELSFTEVFLDPGWYFAVVAFQSLDTGGTNPAIRTASSMGSTATRTSVAATANQQVSWAATVSGALADNPTMSTTTPFIPHIWLKVSTL